MSDVKRATFKVDSTKEQAITKAKEAIESKKEPKYQDIFSKETLDAIDIDYDPVFNTVSIRDYELEISILEKKLNKAIEQRDDAYRELCLELHEGGGFHLSQLIQKAGRELDKIGE